MNFKNLLLLLFFVASFISCGKKQNIKISEVPLHEDVSAIVDSVYDAMTWDERIPQLYGIRPEEVMEDGKVSFEKCKKVIPHGIGHFSQYAVMYGMEPDSLRKMVLDIQKYLKQTMGVFVPALFHEEMITGFASKGCTMFPQQLCASCSWDPELLEQKTIETAKTARSLGGMLALSPVLDVDRTPTFNRIEESNGEDAYLTSREGLAFIDGLQRGDLRKGVATCNKHFLGYGGGSELSDKEIFEEILMPHEVAIEKGGSQVVMIKYNEYKGEMASSSKYLMQGILRDYLDFKGMIVSDYSAILNKKLGGKMTSQERRKVGVNSLSAGMDVEFSEGYTFLDMKKAIDTGEISEKEVETAIKRVLTLKARLGLLDEDKKFISDSNYDCDSPKSRKVAYDLAKESVVLLKNNGILPLNKGKKIALVGPNANSFWAMCGDYTFQSMYSFHRGGKVDGKNPEILTLLESLKLNSNLKIKYGRGCDWSKPKDYGVDRNGKEDPGVSKAKKINIISPDETNWDKTIAMAAKQDIIIAAMGENVALSGEGRWRKGLKLPGEQQQFVQDLISTGKPVILIIFGGRPQVIKEISGKCSAIMLALYPGEEGGPAISDILTGKVSPSGKLSVTYPTVETKELRCYNQGPKLKKADVAYPFGFGLTYSKFMFKNIRMRKSHDIKDDFFEVSFNLKNIGSVKATETTQLYLSPNSEETKKNLKPIQLKGFKRISLEPGDSKEITYRCPMQILSFYNGKDWQISPGLYNILVGSSSRDLKLLAPLEVTGKEIHFKRRNKFFSETFVK